MPEINLSNYNSVLRQIFAISQGHTEGCVDESVEEIAELIKTVCSRMGISVEHTLRNMDAGMIEDQLQKKLADKNCNCIEKLRDRGE